MHNHSSNETVMGVLFEVLNHSIMITVFVIIMMMIIEIINIQSKARWSESLKKRGLLQIVIAAFMGIMPGCMGTFAIVSLYVHRTISFAALVTAMIATSGDEIFVMFAMIPGKSLLIMITLFFIAILSGIVIHIFTKNNIYTFKLQVHNEYHTNNEDCLCFSLKQISKYYKNISFHRALLLFGFTVFTILLITNQLGADEWNWEKVTFLIVSILGLFVVATISEHFLTEHLWHHIVKQHFIKIFLWTFGAFIVIHVLEHYIDVEHWTNSNQHIILIMAVLIGMIPESGPHIVFVSLFAAGNIPFSILLANSIVQDGHGAIPLLAESRKGFIAMKFLHRDYGATCGMLCGSMANPMALDFLSDKVSDDSHNVVYATVYPISMFLRIITAQILLLLFIS